MHYRLESLSIQLKLGNFRPFLITAIYLTDVSLDVFQEFELLVSAIDKENKESIIIGDRTVTCLPLPIAIPSNLKTLLTTYELTQLINEPTRVTTSSKTNIDHIITNRIQYVSDCGAIPCGHDVIYMVNISECQSSKLNQKHYMLGAINDLT